MERYWRMKLWVILIYFPLLIHTIDEETMRAIRVLKTRQQRIRYLSAPTINARIPDLPLSTIHSGSHLINRTTRFYRGRGLSPSSKQSNLNALPIETIAQNHSMKKNTQNGNLSHVSHVTPVEEVKAHGMVQQHETIILPQLSIEDSLGEQLEKLKDSRIADNDQYLNANSIQEEVDVLRLIERTTMMINLYPSVKTTTSTPLNASIEFNTTSSATGTMSESIPSPEAPDPDRPNVVPSLHPSANQVNPNKVPPNAAAPELANPSIVVPSLSTPDLTLPHRSIPGLEHSSPLKGSFNSSTPFHANIQHFNPPIKKVPSTPSMNPLNSTTRVSAPQLALTSFVMYPSQVPANKIVPLPNAAPLPPTIAVPPQFTNNVQSMNSTATPAPNDDTLGCTWDFITNSCKDVFALNWCTRCHDFGNVFLHNCKCLVKNTTPPIATFL